MISSTTMMARRSMMLLLCGSIILAFARGLTIETEAPETPEDYCMKCEADEDCDTYDIGATCAVELGQCTNSKGFLGQGCLCSQDSECASGRCDGVVTTTCRKKLSDGSICNENSDCLSNQCSSLYYCVAQLEITPRLEEIDASSNSAAVAEDQFFTETSNDDTVEVEHVTNEDDANAMNMRCVDCHMDEQCGEGVCLENLCTDPVYGAHPPFCKSCKADDDCSNGYFCDGDGLFFQTVKRCRVKKRNYATCNRKEECRSNHCNVLFRCESTLPDHLQAPRAPTTIDSEDVEEEVVVNNKFSPNLAIWAGIAAALATFATGICCFCRRQHYKASKRKAAVENMKQSRKAHASAFCEQDICIGTVGQTHNEQTINEEASGSGCNLCVLEEKCICDLDREFKV